MWATTVDKVLTFVMWATPGLVVVGLVAFGLVVVIRVVYGVLRLRYPTPGGSDGPGACEGGQAEEGDGGPGAPGEHAPMAGQGPIPDASEGLDAGGACEPFEATASGGVLTRRQNGRRLWLGNGNHATASHIEIDGGRKTDCLFEPCLRASLRLPLDAPACATPFFVENWRDNDSPDAPVLLRPLPSSLFTR